MSDELAPATAPRAMRLYAGGNFDLGYLHVAEVNLEALGEALLLRFEGPPGRDSVELVIRRDLLERQL
jgi:hypothetical protein